MVFKALLKDSGNLSLELDFDKMGGVIPVIYKDDKNIIDFGYLRPEEIIKELKGRKAFVDCDNDTLLIFKKGINRFNKNFKVDDLLFKEYRGNKLIPLVVQDEVHNPLMLAYGTKETIIKSMETGVMNYYSRKRGWWLKGETSGNYQYLKKMVTNERRDCVVVTVKPSGPACHTNNYSCFYREISVFKKD